MDMRELASRMVRDLTISAKRYHDLARDYRAMAATWRQVLDDTPADLLPSPSMEKGVVFDQKTLPEDPFGPFERSHD